MTSRLISKLDEWFAIDLRSLAAFRVTLAAVFLFDLAGRARDLRAHYTEAGVLPAAVLEQVAGSGIRFSLHYYLSSFEWAIAALFVLAGMAGLALLLGYRTRLATFACWFLLASAQVRNPHLNVMGGDKLLNVLLTWSLLLPLGARFSIDCARAGGRSAADSDRLRSVPGAGLLLQVCLVYWVTGLKKDGTTWLDGSAVYYALHLDYWATSFGAALREHEQLLPLFTHATRWFELLGPFLAFSPIFTQPLRMLTIVLFAGFHLILALSFDIGMFPLVSMVGWLAFLPTGFWDWIQQRSGAVEKAAAKEASGSASPVASPWYAQLAGLALLVYIVTSLAISVGWLHWRIPEPIRQLASALRVQQSWSMFAPDPNFEDTWPVVMGTLQSGQAVDLFRGTPPTFEKPESIAATLPSFRWRIYFGSLVPLRAEDRNFEPSYQGLVGYWCRRWNASHSGERRLREVQVAIVFERTLENREADPVGVERYRGLCENVQPR